MCARQGALTRERKSPPNPSGDFVLANHVHNVVGLQFFVPGPSTLILCPYTTQTEIRPDREYSAKIMTYDPNATLAKDLWH